MSWSIYVTGSKEGVRKAVAEAKAYGTDQTQIDGAKAVILAAVDASPDGLGIKVEAGGHHDSCQRQLKIDVSTITLAL